MLYGIGMNRSLILCDSIHRMAVPVVKMIFTVLVSSIITWVIIENLLIPLKLVDMYPFVASLVFLVVSMLFELIVRMITQKSASEFIVSFLMVMLCINESLNLLDVVVISLSCIFSFFILIPLLYSIKNRGDITGNPRVHANVRSLLFISLAILICAVAACSISWLNPGVIK